VERTERAVEVPRANDTVATSRVPSGKKQIVTLEAVQPTWRAAAWEKPALYGIEGTNGMPGISHSL
jgi:hypothetical protein